jgi:hypothetical protein
MIISGVRGTGTQRNISVNSIVRAKKPITILNTILKIRLIKNIVVAANLFVILRVRIAKIANQSTTGS